MKKIEAEANEERLPLETVTRSNLKETEKAIMNKVEIMDRSVQQLTMINTTMEAIVQTLRVEQLMMDKIMLNIKLSIQTGTANNIATKNNGTNRATFVTEAK